MFSKKKSRKSRKKKVEKKEYSHETVTICKIGRDIYKYIWMVEISKNKHFWKHTNAPVSTIADAGHIAFVLGSSKNVYDEERPQCA